MAEGKCVCEIACWLLKLHPSSEKASLLLIRHCPKQVTWLNLTPRGRGSVAGRRTWNIYLVAAQNTAIQRQSPCTEPGTVKVEASFFLSTPGTMGLDSVRSVGLQLRGNSHWSWIQVVLWLTLAVVKKISRIPAYSYVPKLVNPTNQYSLLTCIPVYKFVGQH